MAELERLLVDPLGLSAGVKRLLLSPAGPLAYLPFTLLMPDKEIAYVPSGTVHGLLLLDVAKRGEGVLGLGDPDYGTIVEGEARSLHRGAEVHGLTRLAGSRKEVEAIADLALLGVKATEAGLKGAVGTRARWRAVHFACHGLVDPDRPLLSSLALASAGEDDGFLTCLEVFGMKIPADLVVLSACETGRGRVYEAEGIVGLTRAFMFAGAPRVICSLWKVDDEATGALMERFYELWKPGKVSTATALRKAQAFVAAKEKWKHPYFWAAWQLWGLPE